MWSAPLRPLPLVRFRISKPNLGSVAPSTLFPIRGITFSVDKLVLHVASRCFNVLLFYASDPLRIHSGEQFCSKQAMTLARRVSGLIGEKSAHAPA